MYSKAQNIGSSFYNSLVNWVSSIPDMVWRYLNNCVNTIGNFANNFYNVGYDIMDNLWDGLIDVWRGIANWFSGTLSNMRNWVSNIITEYKKGREASKGHFAAGLDYVPYNGFVATLHEGERVLTKQENKDFNDPSKGGGTDFSLNVGTVVINSDDDIKSFATKFEFYRTESAKARGGK
ncbi:hypothetical protein D3C73_908030 [compost metagenome]